MLWGTAFRRTSFQVTQALIQPWPDREAPWFEASLRLRCPGAYAGCVQGARVLVQIAARACTLVDAVAGSLAGDGLAGRLNRWVMRVHAPVQQTTGGKFCDSHRHPRSRPWPCDSWKAAFRREEDHRLGRAASLRGRVHYEAISSGGGWWPTADDWKALEGAGWAVAWASNHHGGSHVPLTTSAARDRVTLYEAIDEFESVTTQDPYEPGCPCSECGPPHRFRLLDAAGGVVACYPS